MQLNRFNMWYFLVCKINTATKKKNQKIKNDNYNMDSLWCILVLTPAANTPQVYTSQREMKKAFI